MRGEKILHDLVRRLGLAQEELAQARSQPTQPERYAHSKAEFASIREQLQETRVELRVVQDRCDRAQVSAEKLAAELADERRAFEVETRSTEVFRTEVSDLRRQLELRSSALEVAHNQLASSEAARVRAERERDSLAEDVARLSAQKVEAEQRASDLQDDFDVGVEEARYAAAVECREATADENASRGVTFNFFNFLFPLPDGDEL